MKQNPASGTDHSVASHFTDHPTSPNKVGKIGTGDLIQIIIIIKCGKEWKRTYKSNKTETQGKYMNK
jgi:hypothetical protein